MIVKTWKWIFVKIGEIDQEAAVELTLRPWMLFESIGQRAEEAMIEITSKLKPRHLLVCVQCKAEITSEEARIAIQGSHNHSFFNPHGIVYHVGCFSDAPGCAAASARSAEFTWFSGHQWRTTVCGHCHEHLGWDFVNSQGHGFFCLILNRLTAHSSS